jgi:hypothetical protein
MYEGNSLMPGIEKAQGHFDLLNKTCNSKLTHGRPQSLHLQHKTGEGNGLRTEVEKAIQLLRGGRFYCKESFVHRELLGKKVNEENTLKDLYRNSYPLNQKTSDW